GLSWRVVNIEALQENDLARAFKYFGKTPAEPLLYRGWLLHPEEYTRLAEAVQHRGGRLFTSPDAYRRALLFPEFYSAIADHSIPATWVLGCEANRAIAAAREIGPPPYFIKDFAKSAKEIWPRGCVVRHENEMADAIHDLREYRGDRFEGGIVIRPFVALKPLGEHPFGGTLYEEFRLFFFKRKLISISTYDRSGGDPASLPDYRFLGDRLDSPFFSADVVTAADGRRFILECGDGGTSALPPSVSPVVFYKAMLNAFVDD
ncbi:MAG TPA: ATP-grasp domain-containing protein, partial [Pirellulales bacterium]